MIDEGMVIDFVRELKCLIKEYEIQADLEDRAGDTRNFFWNAGIVQGYKQALKAFCEDFGIEGVYGKERRIPRDFKKDTAAESAGEDRPNDSAVC